MEISYSSYFEKFKVTGQENEISTIVLIFDAPDYIVQRLVLAYFNPVAIVPLPIEESNEIKQRLGLSGNCRAVINNIVPSMIIEKNNKFMLINEGNCIEGGVSQGDLKRYGFESLKEIVNADCLFQVLFVSRLGPSHTQVDEIHQSFIFTPKFKK